LLILLYIVISVLRHSYVIGLLRYQRWISRHLLLLSAL